MNNALTNINIKMNNLHIMKINIQKQDGRLFYQFIIQYKQEIIKIMFNDQSSILNNFLTPGYLNKTSQRSTTNGKRRSVHKRTPIFNYYNKNANNTLLSKLRNSSNLQDQSFTEKKVIIYDFCGCENQMSPCDVITKTFLSNAKRQILRSSYEQESQLKQGRTSMRESRYKKALLSQLPNWYPQLLYSHLKNLIQVAGIQLINYPQFLCLAAIEYHSKVEYLTYYLYEDLKKTYSDKQKFKKDCDRELAKLGTNFYEVKAIYSDTVGLSNQLVEFINEYYDSVGANLVPFQTYAKFLEGLYLHGNRLFVRMLINFIVFRKEELKKGLKFLRLSEAEIYRNYMRQLNFQQFIKQAK